MTNGGRSEESLPTVWLDAPAAGEVVRDSLRIRGWAVLGPWQIAVEAWLGDRRLGFLDLAVRPDVAERHGEWASPLCGFETVFPIDVHESGPRRLRVVVTAADGTVDEVECEVRLEGAVPSGASPDEPRRGYRVLRGPLDGDGSRWFDEHYTQAVGEILEFVEGSSLSLAGKSVADVGCGDGIIDLGLMHRASPSRLVGFDLEEVGTGELLAEARSHDVAIDELPGELEFRVCSTTALPADDESFDAVVSWSTFEHVRHPIRLMREIRRIMHPEGYFFLQIWPLWWSQHGSHLWPWYAEGFAPLVHTDEEVLAGMRADPRGPPDDMRFIADEYRRLNRVKVDELQRCLLAAGLTVAKFELLSSAVHVPAELSRYPLTDLGIDGIKLLAVRS